MATQFKQRADLSFDITSQAVFGEVSLENPNVNLDHSSSTLNYDQVIYSYLNSYGTLEHEDNAVNEEPLVDVEQDTDATPADSVANSSDTLSNVQIIDMLDSYNPVDNAGNGGIQAEIIRDEIENSISDDASCLEEFITDETITGNYDQITPPLADEEFFSVDLVESDFDITEEASEDPFVYLVEEPIEDYEVPNDMLVDDSSYIPTDLTDDHTDPLAEVTDEPFTIYSYFYCGTMDVSFSLEESIDESYQSDGLDFSLAVCDISFDELTFDDAPIDNLNEVAADDLTIIPLGLPTSPDYGYDWGWGCCCY